MSNLNKPHNEAFLPVIDILPYKISECEPGRTTDPYVWEQPMSTELHQFKLHQQIKLGENIDHNRKIINTYLGLPWGRFDAVHCYYPLELIQLLKTKIQQLKAKTTNLKYTLKVHTTVQKENWKAFIPLFEEIGVTDVHAVQYEKHVLREFNPFKTKKIKFYCLPFQAINTTTSNRSIGLNKRGFHDKTYLATFKGAHMSHYKSDVRTILMDVYDKENNKTDIYIEITNEWFYNKKTFAHAYKELTKSEEKNIETSYNVSTQEYNELLSNSVFALCPEGGGVNSIRFWEALSIGTIPILIVSEPTLPLMLSIHPDLYKCCYVIYRDNLYTLFDTLRQKVKNVEHIIEMSELCVKVYNELCDRNTFDNQYQTNNSIFSTLL